MFGFFLFVFVFVFLFCFLFCFVCFCFVVVVVVVAVVVFFNLASLCVKFDMKQREILFRGVFCEKVKDCLRSIFKTFVDSCGSRNADFVHQYVLVVLQNIYSNNTIIISY